MKKYLSINPPLKTAIREIKQVAGYLWEKGWAERNAGNISVNISDIFEEQTLEAEAETPIPKAYPLLANMYFIITATGSRMRDIAKKPLENILLVKLNAEGTAYITFGQNNSSKQLTPTSELFTHLAMHNLFASQQMKQKAILHTHATELIAVTHDRSLCSETALNELLWSMHPETITFIPEGVGFVPYILPGTEQIAEETIKALQKHKVVVWEKHGVFSTEKTLSEAFDLIDIVAKSAGTYLLCKSAGIPVEYFSDTELEKLKIAGEKFIE